MGWHEIARILHAGKEVAPLTWYQGHLFLAMSLVMCYESHLPRIRRPKGATGQNSRGLTSGTPTSCAPASTQMLQNPHSTRLGSRCTSRAYTNVHLQSTELLVIVCSLSSTRSAFRKFEIDGKGRSSFPCLLSLQKLTPTFSSQCVVNHARGCCCATVTTELFRHCSTCALLKRSQELTTASC